jgi:hypothetical protein
VKSPRYRWFGWGLIAGCLSQMKFGGALDRRSGFSLSQLPALLHRVGSLLPLRADARDRPVARAFLWPDLNLPMNPTEYFTDTGLRALIRDPRTVRVWPSSGCPTLPKQI